MSIPEITVDDIEARQAAGSLVVDVREVDEYVDGHVPGAILVPLSEFTERHAELPTDVDLLMLCRSGGRSLRAAEFLADRGIASTNIAGGTLAWMASGRDVVTGPQPR